MTVRGTLAYVGAFAAFAAVALAVDVRSDPFAHGALGLLAWAFLAVALRLQSPAVRIQVVVLVAVVARNPRLPRNVPSPPHPSCMPRPGVRGVPS